MRDWVQTARHELARRGLAVGDDVASELGAFLEDTYCEALAGGAEPERAASLTLERAGDWAELAQGLRRHKEVRMERVERLWIPGLVNAGLAFGLLRAGTAAGLEPLVRHHGEGALVVYWFWLPFLTLLAGVTTLWSMRCGGSRRERLIVGLFPSIAMLTVLAGLFTLSLVLEAGIGALETQRGLPVEELSVALAIRLTALVSLGATWVAVPGALSLLGAAPFVLGKRPGGDVPVAVAKGG